MDALHKLFLNAVVTGAAGRRYVLGVDRRFRIGSREFAMRGVATGAGGGHRQAAPQQSFAVNALGVTRNDLVLRAGIKQGRLLAFTMALGAEIGHVGSERQRLRIVLAEHMVRTVAVLAEGSIRIALGMHLAVRAALVLLSDFGVAGSAIHPVSNGLAWAHAGGVHLRVALATGHLNMAGA